MGEGGKRWEEKEKKVRKGIFFFLCLLFLTLPSSTVFHRRPRSTLPNIYLFSFFIFYYFLFFRQSLISIINQKKIKPLPPPPPTNHSLANKVILVYNQGYPLSNYLKSCDNVQLPPSYIVHGKPARGGEEERVI